MKELYFARTLTFDVKGEMMFAVSNTSPAVITFDPWPQYVFLAADGQHSIAELIDLLGRQYDGGPPAGLADQVLDIVKKLIDEKAIRLSDVPVNLPYYLAIPRSEQDLEKALTMMRQDGFLQKP